MQETNEQQPLKLDYASPEEGRWRFNRLWIWPLLVWLVVIGMVVAALLPIGRGRSTYHSPKIICSSRLHRIGLGILVYQCDHNQNYPNSLDDLLEEQLTLGEFVCPGSNDVASTAATTQEIIADFHTSGHLSYIYLGQGLTDKTVTDDTVVVYEPPANHAGTGMNVLFGDGHVAWIDAKLATQFLNAVATGVRPVKLNVNTGIVTATQPSTVP